VYEYSCPHATILLQVIQVLKKELQKSDGGGETATPASAGASLKTDEYRKLLMTALHQIAMRFPEVAATVSQIVLNQLGDENMFTALDVIFCIRDIAQEYPQLRAAVVTKLIDNFEQIRFPNVFRTAFWILGEYAEDAAVLDSALQVCCVCLLARACVCVCLYGMCQRVYIGMLTIVIC